MRSLVLFVVFIVLLAAPVGASAQVSLVDADCVVQEQSEKKLNRVRVKNPNKLPAILADGAPAEHGGLSKMDNWWVVAPCGFIDLPPAKKFFLAILISIDQWGNIKGIPAITIRPNPKEWVLEIRLETANKPAP